MERSGRSCGGDPWQVHLTASDCARLRLIASDCFAGEAAIRGTYTSAAVDLLIKAITAAKAPLTFRKEKFILGPGNHVRN